MYNLLCADRRVREVSVYRGGFMGAACNFKTDVGVGDDRRYTRNR